MSKIKAFATKISSSNIAQNSTYRNIAMTILGGLAVIAVGAVSDSFQILGVGFAVVLIGAVLPVLFSIFNED